MRHPVPFFTGAVVGALAMYYSDSVSGPRRRALARDQFVAAWHEVCELAEAKGKRAVDHLKGVAATGHRNRETRSPPQSDQQLHERIRARLGRLVSYPKAIEVQVEQGRVCLKGHVLTAEQAPLISEVSDMAGVTVLRSELVCHDRANNIAELEGRMGPADLQEIASERAEVKA